MFGNKRFQKNGVRVTKDDIKKSIQAANDRLKNANNKLDQDIADKKKSLVSVGKEIDSFNKGLKSLSSEIESAKHDAIKVKAEASRERAKLSKLKTQVAKTIADEDKAQSSINNLAEESALLDKNISRMNSDLAIASALKEEIKLLKSDKKVGLKELDKISSEAEGFKNELSQLKPESAKKKKAHKALLAKLDAEAEVKQKELDTVDGEHVIKMAELNTQIRALKDSVKDKKQEDDIMQSLIKKRELDYIDIEAKYKQAENALMFTQEITNKEIEREKSEVKKVKDQFKQWKMSVLEEVARMKLKNKIEKINKAGLAEILNG